jgi:hypothetical protein
MVIENIYNSYFEYAKECESDLKELLQFFCNDINLEDLICFMANIYPNHPFLRDTIFFDLLKFYKISRLEWSLINVHFKCDKSDFKLLKI